MYVSLAVNTALFSRDTDSQRLDAYGSGFAVVGDLLMGDADVVKVFQG